MIANDFGDPLDAASGEYLAARLRRRSGQLWLRTRQAEVPRAFEATDLLRLTRIIGSRQAFLFTLLGPAMSARTVVLLEGPHDMKRATPRAAVGGAVEKKIAVAI